MKGLREISDTCVRCIGKSLNVGVLLDVVWSRCFKLSMMITSSKFYMFTPVFVTLTHFQGHWRVWKYWTLYFCSFWMWVDWAVCSSCLIWCHESAEHISKLALVASLLHGNLFFLEFVIQGALLTVLAYFLCMLNVRSSFPVCLHVDSARECFSSFWYELIGCNFIFFGGGAFHI